MNRMEVMLPFQILYTYVFYQIITPIATLAYDLAEMYVGM